MRSTCIPALRTAVILGAFTLAGHTMAQSGNIAVNRTGAAADPKAILDISSTSMGLLIPRMSEAQKNNIPAPLPDGLLVFQTNTTRGFYVVHEGAWTPLTQGKGGWDVWGNYLLNTEDPTPDFIGTTDARSMMFRTNNIHRMQLDYSTGYLAVGHPINTGAAGAAKERLDIGGALGMYFYRNGSRPSETAAPGVIRYQPYGITTGSAPYQYGSYELGGTYPPNNATIWGKVWGTTKFAPLMHAGHWGNISGVDTTRGTVLGTAPETITQPDLGGWRSFENPYEEHIGVEWDHFREAVCSPGGQVIIPYGWGTGAAGTVMSNDAALPLVDRTLATPFNRSGGAVCFIRRQYLFFPDEINLELAQVNGTAAVTGGLCPGGEVNEIAFYRNGTYTRGLALGHVIVRNAPVGLQEMFGFDNTPVEPGSGMGCGQITSASWPSTTGNAWETVTLTTPFVWDGTSNVLVEVAVMMSNALPNATPAPVAVRETAVNTTYSATATNTEDPTRWTSMANPYPPGPGWGCANIFGTPPTYANANKGVLLPDFGAANFESGSSKWRPVIRFGGEMAAPGPATSSAYTGRYIHYTGALVMEDPNAAGRINSLSPGLPWGRWRFNFPTGTIAFNYKGDGTISAQKGVFDNRIRLNDHVFDRNFDGRVAAHEAAEFGDRRNLSIREMADFASRNRHLPTMKGRSDWNRTKGFSVGDLTNQLWTTAETHALYVADLNDKLNLLEILSNDRPLGEDEFRMAQKELATMPEYNDAEKARLIADLRRRTTFLHR